MKSHPISVHLPDTRDVTISRYGSGNLKLGFGVYTYSRIAGDPRVAPFGPTRTCPGSTAECEAICYAKRIEGPVADVYLENSVTNEVPPIPADCKVLRIHVSGDFDSPDYIRNWVKRLQERPDVTAWAYTRSWRVPLFVPFLEELRALPNLQLFASMDPSCADLPPVGWRRSWIWRAQPNGPWPMESRLETTSEGNLAGEAFPEIQVATVIRDKDTMTAMPGFTEEKTPSYVCPEETGTKPNCLACGYCFEGKKNDVTFIEH